MVLFICISSQQYLLQTKVDLAAFECTLVESDNFYIVKVHFARYLELPCESFFSNRFTVSTFLAMQTNAPRLMMCKKILKHLIFRDNFAQLKACVHSWKVVSGIKLYNCFVFLFLNSKFLTNPTVDNLLYFEIAKVKAFFANSNTAQTSEFRTYHCTMGWSL